MNDSKISTGKTRQRGSEFLTVLLFVVSLVCSPASQAQSSASLSDEPLLDAKTLPSILAQTPISSAATLAAPAKRSSIDRAPSVTLASRPLPNQKPNLLPAEPAAQVAGRASIEGIKVHGHWTLEVRNSDGSVARRVEFENSLVQSGAEFLAGVISGNFTAGSWVITLAGEPNPCSLSCALVTPTAAANNPEWANLFGQCPASSSAASSTSCYATLTESLGTPYPSAGILYTAFMLNGSAYITQTTYITQVATYVGFCSNLQNAAFNPTSVPPSSCVSSAANLLQFSGYALPSPGIAVTNGQTVQVGVQFSFQY
jgi:hypothetical protein